MHSVTGLQRTKHCANQFEDFPTQSIDKSKVTRKSRISCSFLRTLVDKLSFVDKCASIADIALSLSSL